jgi:hypothetical protein
MKVQPCGCGNVRACETYGPLTIAADRRCPPASLVLISCGRILRGTFVGRDYEPVKGQWYENVEEDETFRVLYLERIEEPEGWAAEDGEEEDEEDEDEDLDEDDDDWDDDEDDDEDDDWDEEEEEGQY